MGEYRKVKTLAYTCPTRKVWLPMIGRTSSYIYESIKVDEL
jgi:hypothetical protein